MGLPTATHFCAFTPFISGTENKGGGIIIGKFHLNSQRKAQWHCNALHCIALHYIALHCNASIVSMFQGSLMAEFVLVVSAKYHLVGKVGFKLELIDCLNNCSRGELDVVTPLITDPPCVNSSPLKNPVFGRH